MKPPIDESTSLLAVAGAVSSVLRRHGIEAVLTGGAVVSIYSRNAYQTHDLDFVTIGLAKDVASAMRDLGFERKGRHWAHPASEWYVEFPSGPLSIGDSVEVPVATKRTPRGVLKLLPPTECVMDRLAAFFHWNDRQSLDQAVLVAKKQQVDLGRIRTWSRREGMSAKLAEFEGALAQSEKGRE